MEANTSNSKAAAVGDVPSLLADVEVSNLAGFDVTTTTPNTSPQPVPAPVTSPKPLLHPNNNNNNNKQRSRAQVPPLALDRVARRTEVVILPPFDSPGFRSSVQPMSVSLPSSPSGFGGEPIVIPAAGAGAGSSDLRRQAMANASRDPAAAQDKGSSNSGSVRFSQQPDKNKMMFRSQPIPCSGGGQPSSHMVSRTTSRGGARAMYQSRDKRYDTFKTWSGKLERQLTHLAGGGVPDTAEEEEGDDDSDEDAINNQRAASMPKVDRFFAALEGPELDQLKSSEELVLPSDKRWPFLLRFPVSAFGICLGVSSQAILYKTIATSAPTTFLHVSSKVNLVLWFIAVALMCVITVIYAFKIVFFFEAVRREYYHPIRVNFFFAPWIACLFLAMGVPPSVVGELPQWLWYALMAPVLCLELKIYGQWMSGGQRRLSKVANPSNHLSVVGNFVGALLGASMGLKEGPLFFFAAGMAHYVVLFVTLYQRLPTNETLPKELHPVFFLFVAAPSVASMAWAKITGEFGLGSKLAYFIAMFLYASLAVRINFFRGFRFSLAWWAYTFPMTGAAIASIKYSTAVDNTFTKTMCVGLSVLATLTVAGLFATTLVHAFVFRNLFPNDISIAITDRKMKPIMELHEDDDVSGNSKDIEAGGAAAGATAAVAPEV